METTLIRKSLRATYADHLRDQLHRTSCFPARIRLEIRPEDRWSWLAAQPLSHKLVWCSRDEHDFAMGLGCAARLIVDSPIAPDQVITECRKWLAGHPQLRVFGGFAFRHDRAVTSDEWRPFANAQFWLPRVMIDGSGIHCVVLGRQDMDQAIDDIDRLIGNGSSRPVVFPSWQQRLDAPDRPTWDRHVQGVLELASREIVEKVVLARRTEFQFGDRLDPIAFSGRLCQVAHGCYRFCFQVDTDCAFVGASPERLFRRTGAYLESEVVAGTRPRGATIPEDLRLAQELLGSRKDQLEHDVVRKSIRQRLHPCVQSLDVDAQATLLKLARKQHLYSRVWGTLHAAVSDGQLVERLHPTPAVGGYPTENALCEIDRLEPFDRGWYAGPVGWIAAESAEFAVGIRSALIQGCRLLVYSGAGIVPGSTPQAEWDEIENKIGDFLEVMQKG